MVSTNKGDTVGLPGEVGARQEFVHGLEAAVEAIQRTHQDSVVSCLRLTQQQQQCHINTQPQCHIHTKQTQCHKNPQPSCHIYTNHQYCHIITLHTQPHITYT